MDQSIIATDKIHLKKLMDRHIGKYGNECDLNHIDVSHITDFSYLFCQSEFNGNISEWNLSNALNTIYMFSESSFKGDISQWNVSNVKNMRNMFYGAVIYTDLSSWNVSNVQNMRLMFCNSEFNGDISKWNVSNVTDMNQMFAYCLSFKGDLSQWDVSNVKNMDFIFNSIEHKFDLINWNIHDECSIFYPFEKEYVPDHGIFYWYYLIRGNTSKNELEQKHLDNLLPVLQGIELTEVACAKYLYQTYSSHTTTPILALDLS